MQSSPFQVFLTRNSEYYLQSHVCVGVRDRRTGRWFTRHPALTRPLAMTVSTAGQRFLIQMPVVGESLEFAIEDDEPFRTTPILAIERRARAACPTMRTLAATPHSLHYAV
ncbi:MAG: hypothetical protein ABW321_30535 [Polyangiales bacterium]